VSYVSGRQGGNKQFIGRGDGKKKHGGQKYDQFSLGGCQIGLGLGSALGRGPAMGGGARKREWGIFHAGWHTQHFK